ncbi:MAG: phosphatase PAP2 family protein, partial [Chloroflexota bacterium]|nr:phosphatase PAP2 family protein [Chloroflexota bacterium]
RTEAARRGRELLREAMLRQMGPLQALDARLFLAVNQLPRTPWLNKLADTITLSTTGGWIWVLGLLGARVLGVRGTENSLRCVAPAVLGATFIVEHPIKSTFRRRRPFIDVVRALVIGRRPDGWSFPSGHTAAAFAGALMLSHVWPTRAPLFFLGATTVGFSRVYVGAHYPGDVMSGATLGLTLAEAIRQVIKRIPTPPSRS